MLRRSAEAMRVGKYWHRHRRPRPVTYNSSLEYHQGLIRAEEMQKSAAKRKRPQSTVVEEVKPQIAEDEDMGTPAPRSKTKAAKEMSAAPDGGPSEAPDRAISPVSTASSGSEPPLAHRVKMNGTYSKSAPPAPSEPEVKVESASASRVVSPPEASPPRPAPSAPPPAQNPPVGVGILFTCVSDADDLPPAARDPPVADGFDDGDAGQVPR